MRSAAEPSDRLSPHVRRLTYIAVPAITATARSASTFPACPVLHPTAAMTPDHPNPFHPFNCLPRAHP
jgi:hypothetical protein